MRIGDLRGLIRDATPLTIAQYLGLGVGLLTNIIAARFLGASRFGTASLIIAFPSLALSVASFKTSQVTVRYLSRYREHDRPDAVRAIGKTGLLIDFGVSVLVAFLVLATVKWVNPIYLGSGEWNWLTAMYALSYPFFSLTGTSWAVLSTWSEFDRLAVIQVAYRLLTLLLVSVALSMGFGIVGYIISLGISKAIYGLGMGLAAHYRLKIAGLGGWWKTAIKQADIPFGELTEFFGWNYLRAVLGGVLVQGPLMLLGRYSSEVDAGYYGLATTLTAAARAPERSVRKVAFPELSRQEVRYNVKQIWVQLQNWTRKIGVPLAGVLIVGGLMAPPIIPLFFGESFSGLGLGLQFMLVGAVGSAVVFWNIPFAYATAQLDKYVKGMTVYTLVVLGGGAIASYRYGFEGMALTYGVTMAIFELGVSVWLLGPILRSKGDE